ncbi:MAG TPA: protein kinase, partial [Opitutaceae bacterium]|nr:protein kinase [Opitutaceae bacterium]
MASSAGDADPAAVQRNPEMTAPGTLMVGGRVFGRYLLQAYLGRGGMGVVWLARDGELECEVALKFLPESVATDKEAIRDLKRETRRSRDLTHPHIVRVHDFAQDGTLSAIVMEYVAGESLASRKADAPGGCLAVFELAPLVPQLCAALDYAHAHARVVHCDL